MLEKIDKTFCYKCWQHTNSKNGDCVKCGLSKASHLNGSKPSKEYCYYCDKKLSVEKGEIAHGCLDCHHTVQADRIDDRDRKIKELKEENKKIRSELLNVRDENVSLRNLI